jgi:hypothetical protein
MHERTQELPKRSRLKEDSLFEKCSATLENQDIKKVKRKGQACTPQVAPGTSCLGY